MTSLIVPFALAAIVVIVAVYQRWANEIDNRVLSLYLLGAMCVAIGAYYLKVEHHEAIILYIGIFVIFSAFSIGVRQRRR
jgi:uncharacterized membrane protein YfcA